MHYKVRNLTIKTENTAKPHTQPSRVLIEWINQQNNVKNALDYGCGKLRYSHALANHCIKLTLVDSIEQIQRIQKIWGKQTNIINYARTYLHQARVLSTKEFKRDTRKYDLILCAHVLSVIPLISERQYVIKRLATGLKPDGKCLFVTQFRSSYFTKTARSSKSIPHLDGWLLNSRNRSSFYGLIDLTNLEDLVSSNGFAVAESWVRDDSAYVLGSVKR